MNAPANISLPERGMSESRHTPTPWQVDEVRTSIGRAFRIGSGEMLRAGKGCCIIYDDYGRGENAQKANAAFVVTACNSYAVMKAALMGIVARPDIPPDDGTELAPWLRRVYDALAMAEGKV